MLTRTTFFTLATAMVLSLATTNSAQAYDGCGYGFGYDIGRLYNSLEFRVPYFAAHPPVYYSHPVPRTYGHSPFAYPPHFRTPDVVAPSGPIQISNPYVPKAEQIKDTKVEAKDPTVSAPTPSQPLVIHNPYVVDTAVAASR